MTWAARIPTLAGLRYPQASFVLDFASNYYRGSGAQGSSPSALPGYNFTRALAAYGEDTAGNLIQFASGVPRITNKGVLIEESRTNLLLWSQEFDNAYWSTAASAVVADQVVAPDGSLTADKLNETASTAFHYVSSSEITISSATVYTGSIYAKAGERSSITLKLANGWAIEPTATFDLTTGTVSGVVNATATAVPVAGGWFRLALVGGVSTSTTGNLQVILGSSTYAGTPGNGVYIWQADLQAGSFITSPIPTTSTSATRPADVFYFASGTVPLQSAMTLVAQTGAVANTSAARWMFQTGADTTNNRIGLAAALALTTLVPRYVQAGSGKSASDITGVLSAASDNTAAIAFSIGGNVRAAANGLLSGTPGSDPTALPAPGNFNIGADNSGSFQFNGYIKRIVVYPFAASDAQLQSISSGNF